ncbi:MAG: cya 1, partial [Lacunisphaera sp.]|nr:cya 1 [Lacunisphaera sp.]
NDLVIGGTGGDTLTVGNGNNVVFGDNGEAMFVGGVRSRCDTFAPGDSGADIITSGIGDDTILAGAGADNITAGDGDNVVVADEGRLTYDAAGRLADAVSLATDMGADDVIVTGAGNDLIIGGTGDDTIDAGNGNNVVFGDNGEAQFLAGIRAGFATTAPDDAGDDSITSGTGNDVILGGAGVDTIQVTGGDNLVFGDEAEVTFDTGGIITEAISLVLDDGATDVITTGAGNDVIVGGFGADSINGGDGNNVVIGDNGDAVYSGGLPVLFDTLTPENSANDTITTGSGRDQILGGAGADTINSGAGNDFIVGDEGSITSGGGITIRITTTDYDQGTGDTILGGAGDDLILGGAGSDHIDGGEGNNVILGDNGMVTLPGGILLQVEALAPAIGATDFITAGAGSDVIMGGAAGDEINGGDGGNIVIGDEATITFAGGRFATLTPTSPGVGGDDTIHTGAGNDCIVAGTGADWIDAGNGNNVIAGDHAFIDQTLGVLVRVESVAPADGGVDLIFAGSGNDLIIGGTGGDTIHAGAGNDLVFGDHALVTGNIDLALLPLAMPVKPFTFVSIFTQNVGADGRAVAGDDVIFGDAGDDILLGQQGADILFGQDGDDDLIGGHNVSGGQDGGDVIDGGAGYDVIAGDNASILRTGDNISPRAHVLAGTAMFDDRGNLLDLDTPQAWPTAVPERATILLDHAFDTAAGLSGNDQLVGGGGDDVIFGGLGDDMIHGDAALAVNVAADGTIDRAAVRATAQALFTTNLWHGADSDGDDYIEGNGGNDLIFGGLGQDDIVGGSSSLFGLTTRDQRPDGADIIYGGNGTAAADESAGDASLNGRARDADVIMGDNANIIRLVGVNGISNGAFLTFSYNTGGTEKIIVRGFDLLDYTVPASPDDIGGSDTIYGEAGDDTLHGEVSSDLLMGNGNDDNLYGGQGDDNLYGGAGDDSISPGDELQPPPPAQGSTAAGAAEGNGAEGTLPGTIVFVVPSNVPAGLWFGGDTIRPQFVVRENFFTSFSTSSPRIDDGHHAVFGGDDSTWRVFSSGIIPASGFGGGATNYTAIPVSPSQMPPPPAPLPDGGQPPPPAPDNPTPPPPDGNNQPPPAPPQNGGQQPPADGQAGQPDGPGGPPRGDNPPPPPASSNDGTAPTPVDGSPSL